MLEAQTFQERTFGSEEVLALVADKWTVQILHAVMEGHNRFGALRRAIPTITRRMLTLRLRELERNGLLVRVDYGEVPPRVVYGLTPLGQSLTVELKSLCQWSKRNLAEVEKARGLYDSINGETQDD
jgi:DNA-binding HxlR family transcriptional regulator